MEEKKNLSIPTFVVIGDSSSGKTHTTGKLANPEYSEGLKLLTGSSATTPHQTSIVIDPTAENGYIKLKLHSSEIIHTKLIENLRQAMISECKNIIASLPENDENALDEFVKKAVEKRSVFNDATFKVHRLLVEKEEKYHELLSLLFSKIIKKASEPYFRRNYRETSKKSKSEATSIVENLVNNVIENEIIKDIDGLVELIFNEIELLLNGMGFDEDSISDLSPERFIDVIKIISNTDNKDLVDKPSVACGIKEMEITIPGIGLKTNESNNSKYRVIDVVGINNDGLGNVNNRLKEAILTEYNYDGILYFASKKTINKMHESYLESIFKTMRPAKLIVISTFMDRDDVFDADDYPSEKIIRDANEFRKTELLEMIDRLSTSEANVILPNRNDVICISNKVTRRHGDEALAVYNDYQYNGIREALSRSIQLIRKKISLGLPKGVDYLKPQNDIVERTGEIINHLGNLIDDEYSRMRDYSDKIHHWTLDAVLWNMIYGYQHRSDAKVWENVTIVTFNELSKSCREALGEFKFISEAKVSSKEDANRIKKEFEANLRMELFQVSKSLILIDSKDLNKNSEYKERIKQLAIKSKYDKWKIIDDLRLILLDAVAQKEYLQELIESAVSNSLLETSKKVLY